MENFGLMGTSAIARAAGCSEDTVRRADRCGLITLRRDSAGRRLGDWRDVEVLRANLLKTKRRAAAP